METTTFILHAPRQVALHHAGLGSTEVNLLGLVGNLGLDNTRIT